MAGYRFTTLTPDDHAGLIYITALLTFVYSNLTIITRCRLKLRIFGLDDWAMLAAQVANIIQFTLLMVSLSIGLGKRYDMLTQVAYERTVATLYGNQIILYLSLGLSKISTLALVERLAARDQKKFKFVCHIVNGLCVAFTIVSAFLVSVGCSPRSVSPSTQADICPTIFVRYQIVTAVDALTDIVLVILPTYLVWQLHMSAQLKAQVISVFAFRLPLLPLSILVLSQYDKALHSTNPGVDRTPAILFQQSQLCWAILAGTLPCLKSFIRSFDTGSGGKLNYSSNGYGSNGYGSKGDGHGESFRMQSMNNSTPHSRHEDDGEVKVNKRAPKGEEHGNTRMKPMHSAKVKTTPISYSSKEIADSDAASHGSQELIIRRDVQWEVHSENLR